MKAWSPRVRSCVILPLFFLLWAASVAAQTGAGTLGGQVTDPSGAIVLHVTVTATAPNGQSRTAATNGRGEYKIKDLAAGSYVITATAKGFATFTKKDVAVNAGRAQRLDISLALPTFNFQVTVKDQGEQTPHVDVSPSGNVSALVLKGKDLDMLSDDPDELQSELLALAGPSAGPNGGQIYIDGFSGGQLPPKSAIREIRINQNPFSAEYDKLGYGRIEIFTKPGTGQYHGQFFFNDNNSIFNSKSPFIDSNLQPSYNSEMFNGYLSGPLNKRASFFLNAQRRNINNSSIVDATGVPSELGLAQTAVPSPSTRTTISPRLDYQISQNNTLTVRYQFTQVNQDNRGVGQLALASQAYNVDNTEHTLQITDTQVLSPSILNETKFEYIRERNNQLAQDSSPTLNVLGAFLAGGNSLGLVTANQDHYELQNYTSIAVGTHSVKFGGRLRAVRDANVSQSNFNGTFTFPNQAAYLNGQPSQFSITEGNPVARLTLFDAGLYAQDDWRIRPNMSLSYGLRLETQNHISDHVDLAPRLSFAWGIGRGKKPPKTVLRAGFGIFYDRFTDDLLLQEEQLNGVNLQKYIVNSPNFYPVIPTSVSSSPGVQPTLYQVDPRLHAPYIVQTAVSLERQISNKATLSVTYLNSRGFDQLLTRNINAPLPGTYNPADPTSGIRPLGNIGNVYQFESEGIFRQNQLITNFRIMAGSKLSLFGYYALSYVNSDTAGANSFPSNQYDLMQDYGRAAYDIRHRLFVGGTFGLPYAFRVSPFIMAHSGQPFNITLPQDLNGDGIFNDRPSFCQPTSTDCATTSLGTFDLNPAPNAALIPVNYGTGPAQFTVNMRLAKTFSFGKRPEAASAEGPQGPGGPPPHGGHHGGPAGGGLGPRGLSSAGGHPFGWGENGHQRYTLTLSAFAINLLNRVNAAAPIGVLTSPLFGQSNALAGAPFGTTDASRRIFMQVIFGF